MVMPWQDVGVRKWCAIGVVLVLVAGVATVLFQVRNRVPNRLIRLRDGSVLTLRTTTFGRVHAPELRHPLLLRMDTWTPAFLRRFLGSGTMGGTFQFGSGDCLVLWLALEKGEPPTYQGAWPKLRLELDDGHGTVYRGVQQATCAGPQGMTLHGVIFECFPRRHPVLTLHISDEAGPLGEMTVDNPVHGPFPSWTPRPLPQSVTNGEIVFRLETMEWKGGGAGIDRKDVFVPRLVALRGGEPAPEWEISVRHFEDATGNASSTGLSESEPAWKLFTTWFESPESSQAEGRSLHLRKIPVPALGQRLSLTESGAPGGVGLTLAAIAGPGTYNWSNNVYVGSTAVNPGGDSSSSSSDGIVSQESHTRSQLHLLFSVTNLPVGDRVIVRGQDDRGRRFTSVTLGSLRELRTLNLPVPAGAQFLDLELIPQSSRTADFIFAPAPGTPPVKVKRGPD